MTLADFANTHDAPPADAFKTLGIKASLRADGPDDRIAAHKWFNIAAAFGSGEAIQLRRELAFEMSGDEIARAQRLAREFLASARG